MGAPQDPAVEVVSWTLPKPTPAQKQHTVALEGFDYSAPVRSLSVLTLEQLTSSWPRMLRSSRYTGTEGERRGTATLTEETGR